MSPEDALRSLHRVFFDDKDDKEAAMTTGARRATMPTLPCHPVVAADDWQRGRDQLLIAEKAHTRAGDAVAAQRRRLR